MARLIVQTEEGPETFDLAEMATLGRHPVSDVPVIDARASKSHCVVEHHGDTYVLRDLGSMNGTFLNGARIDGETQLDHGDEITIGSICVKFEDPDREAEGVTASDLAFRELAALAAGRGAERAPIPGVPTARLRSRNDTPARAPVSRDETAPTPPPMRPMGRRAPVLAPAPASGEAENLFDDLFGDLDTPAPARPPAPPADVPAAPVAPAPLGGLVGVPAPPRPP